MDNLHCDCCNEVIDVEYTKQLGTLAARVNLNGGVAKCDVFYSSNVGLPSSWKFYCNEECKNKHYPSHLNSLNLPEELRTNIDNALKEVRKDIPKMAKETGEALNRFRDKLLGKR